VLGGGGGPSGGGTNRGTMFISLKPPAERGGLSTEAVIDRLRGISTGSRDPPVHVCGAGCARGGSAGDSDYQYTLSAPTSICCEMVAIVGKRMEASKALLTFPAMRSWRAATDALDRRTKASSLGVRVRTSTTR
jgi:multidrug efflux pump